MSAATISGSELNETLRGLAREYAEAVEALLGESLVSVVLFGSVARGEATPLSDIDVLVVAEGLPPDRWARRDRLEPATEALRPRLDALRAQGILTDILALYKTPAEASRFRPLYLDMTEDAILLYDRDGFFAGVLEGVRASLRRLGSRRLTRGGIRYWDLKPDYKPGEVFTI